MDQLLIDITNLIVEAAPKLIDFNGKDFVPEGEVVEKLVDDILEAIDANREKPWLQYGAENVWGEHAAYPRSEWINDVSEGATTRGYWDWVASCIEADEAEAQALADEEEEG